MAQFETNFENVVPSRYVTFTIGNPFPRPYPAALHSPNLRVSVIDSPYAASSKTSNNSVAVILVPPNRESDWIFSTEAGLLQLILASDDISRLIVISVDSPNSHRPTSFKPLASPLEMNPSQIEENLESLLLKLSPNSLLADLPHDGVVAVIPFVSYEDSVKRSSVLEICVGPCVGEMVIEDVELTSLDYTNKKEFRRRLRFKRMPNYIQSQVTILAENRSDLNDEMENINFKLDNNGLLVQPYLGPMVAGLTVISTFLDSRIQDGGIRPRTLCLGVGGGALVTFLSSQLGFEVVGVEKDQEVLNIGRKYFGLGNSKLVRCFVGDGIELMKKFSYNGKDVDLGGKFDAIMVDLDSSDAKNGSSAPPLEFVQKDVLLGAREMICQFGVLILNLIAPNKSFYNRVVSEFLDVFKELYEIDAGNEENVVFIASVSEIQPASGDQDNDFLKKLKSIVDESYILSMRKIQGIDDY